MRDDVRKAMFHNMGLGAKVRTKKEFGINDVPVGSQGIVVEHFGKDKRRPIVAFSGRGRKVMNPDLIEVISPSKKFEPVRHSRIKVYGEKEKMKKDLIDSGFSDGGDNTVYKYEYLDDGEGHSADVPYSVKIVDNAVEIHLSKKDIPHRWRDSYDGILEGIEYDVKNSLGVSD